MEKPKNNNYYFNQGTEDAIVRYNNTSDPVLRDKIFTREIYYPFYKLVENIIHTFKFYYTEVENIEDLKYEVISFLLQKIDSAWKEHLQQINTLRENIGWRGYGQKDPLIEYKNEAYNLFLSMTTNIRHSVVYLIFKSQPILKV